MFAIKVLRLHSGSDLRKITRVSSDHIYHSILPSGGLTATRVEVLQGGHNVEGSQSSKRSSTIGNPEGQVPTQVCNGVGVDGEWEC